MGKRLFVGNLSFETTSESLKELFSAAGNVESATIMTDRATGRARGFGFVEMSTDAEAERVIAEMNGRELQGRAISVNEARERSADRGRSFSRSFGPPAPAPPFRKDGGSRRGLRGRKRSL